MSIKDKMRELKKACTEQQQPLLIKYHSSSETKMHRNTKWWLSVILNIILLLSGQIAATLLNRYYYDQGGNSKWIETLTFSVAFPILYIPLLFFTTSSSSPSLYKPPLLTLSATYIGIGLITVADSLMYSYALLYLSVSTYSLVCSTQLAFNAVFSYFINKEKFTHLTLNSVVLLTFSAAIIGLRPRSDSASVDPKKVPLGFILTLAASATYSFILSLMELAFDKVIKSRNFSAVLNMQINTALVSTCAAFIGLFASGEFKALRSELDGYKKGKIGWIMVNVWASVAWQVTNVGLIGLIFEVSSLFSNVFSTLAMPLVPVFAVILFRDEFDGMKVVSLLLALWGSISYFYQHYIDYKIEKKGMVVEEEVEVVPS